MAQSTSRNTKNAAKTDLRDDDSAKMPAPGVSIDKPAAQFKTPQREALDAVFRNDASVRQAITENLKPLRAESEAVAKRVTQAFAKFNASELSPEELARRHFVAPGADPAEMLDAVMIQGVDAIRSSNSNLSITLNDSEDLRSLINETRDDGGSLRRTIGLEPLINFISSKQNAQSALTADPAYTICKAKVEAQKILDIVEKAPESGNGSKPDVKDSSAKNREVDLLVKDAVNLQMKSATAPEAQLQYSSIPNSADTDKVQSNILQTFELRPGASDVTSYHDFNTLQIAFAHVWTQIFDGQLDSLGRELYHEYVKLKDFAGSTDPDLTISTLSDLKRLIEEVKSLTVFTEGAMPVDGKGSTDTPPQTQPTTPKDWTERLKPFIPPDPASRLTFEFINWIINEASRAGNKPRLRWTDFDGRQLQRPQDRIIAKVEENVAAPNTVEIGLTRTQGQRWRGIEFQQFDSSIGPNPVYRAMISNASNDPPSQYPGGPPNDGRPIVLEISQLTTGLIEFASVEGRPSEVKLGRYLLGDLNEVLKDRTRVTFDWIEG